jgi:hypothetical protein
MGQDGVSCRYPVQLPALKVNIRYAVELHRGGLPPVADMPGDVQHAHVPEHGISPLNSW